MRVTKQGVANRSRVLAAIGELTEKNKVSPTIREIADEVGLSKSAVFNHLKILREAGKVHCPRPGAGWLLS